jgi:hypothetical protein
MRSSLTGSPTDPFPVTQFPLKQNSILDTRAVFEPAGNTILAGFTSAELTPGLYEVHASWGTLKIAGGGEPTFADITNFASFVDEVKIDDLVSLSGVAATIDGYFNFGGFDFSLRTKIAGTANVCYTAIIVATRLTN